MPQSGIIVVERLVKRYGARPLCRRGVSFAVKEGGIIVGLRGSDGRLGQKHDPAHPHWLSQVLVRLRAYRRCRCRGHAARNHTGYVPETAPLYNWMRIAEFLLFIAPT